MHAHNNPSPRYPIGKHDTSQLENRFRIPIGTVQDYPKMADYICTQKGKHSKQQTFPYFDVDQYWMTSNDQELLHDNASYSI